MLGGCAPRVCVAMAVARVLLLVVVVVVVVAAVCVGWWGWWGVSHVEASEARKMIAPLMSSLFIIRRTAVRRE